MNYSPGITAHSSEILQVISRAPGNLAPASQQKIGEFIAGQLSENGGFFDRSARPDLYYTLFGLSCAYVLQLDLKLDNTLAWLQQLDPSQLTLVELSSLAKSLAIFAMWNNPLPCLQKAGALVAAVERFRTEAGGFSYDGVSAGFPYAAFLAMNLYQDTGCELSQPEPLVTSLYQCQKADGRFANPGSASTGLLLSTIAGFLTLRQLTGKIDLPALDWVKKQYSVTGGFKADPGSELPDMLSTAVALFALKVCGIDMTPYRAASRRFVEEHWLENGSFSATLFDETGDCEYSYYGLLALGALSDV